MPGPARKTILIADDERHVTYMLSLKLSRANIAVVVANDGEEAFGLACQHHPDLVITDFQMPRMSGYELALRLRQKLETTNTPVLMLTARGHRLSPSDLAKTNIQYLMPKPFSAKELLSKVAEFIELDSEPAQNLNAASGSKQLPQVVDDTRGHQGMAAA